MSEFKPLEKFLEEEFKKVDDITLDVLAFCAKRGYENFSSSLAFNILSGWFAAKMAKNEKEFEENQDLINSLSRKYASKLFDGFKDNVRKNRHA